MSSPTCPRHPERETRLRCSSCDTLICPECWRDAAVGYHCPECADRRAQAATGAAATRSRGLFSSKQTITTSASANISAAIVARSVAMGLAASVIGGLVLRPILMGGAFFLLSAGVIGWLVARSVFWASEEEVSPLLRALAMTLAGFSVAIGLATAGVGPVPAGLTFLAYPAALWGGWIVVRQR